MQVEVEQTSALERKMTIQVPANLVDQDVNSRLQRTASQVQLKGFRPGKVPVSVVRQRYGREVRQEVVSELLQKSFQDAIEKESLRPTSAPAVEEVADEEGKDLQFVCTFEVYPDIEIPDFSQIRVEKPVCEIGDAEINEMIEDLRERRPDWAPAERAATAGDKVKVDFVGTLGGEKFEGGSGEGIEFEIGSGYMLPDFEKGCEGAARGDTRTVEVAFPEEYPKDTLAGKAASFEITVQEVSEKTLPELNEEFFKAWGVEDGSEESFRKEVRETMEREAERAARNRIKEALLEQLLDMTEGMDLPQSLLDAEIHRQQHQGHDHEHGEHCDHGEPDEEMKNNAARRVRTGLLMMHIIDSQAIKTDGAKVREAIERMAAPYQSPEQIINWYYSDQQRLQEVENSVLEDQVVDWMLEQADVSDVPASYKDLMGQQEA